MAKIFITLTGTKHYFGNDFLEKGMKIRLEKEPDNEYDKEAIKVTYMKAWERKTAKREMKLQAEVLPGEVDVHHL